MAGSTLSPIRFPSAADRETFLAAVARHRRASWRVTAACAAAVLVLAVVVSILMAPLLYCLMGLGLDVLNLATPAPDLFVRLGRLLDPLFNARRVSVEMIARVAVIAALPGLVLMAILTFALRHVWTHSPLFDAGDVPGRAPDRSVLLEDRLANVVEEMAIAAGIPVPRIVIVPGGANAAACGRDRMHVTLLVGEALAGSVDREQLEGTIADLIGAIANGDMTIGLRVATTLVLFGLIARIGLSFEDRHALWQTVSLWRVFVAPTSAGTAALLGALADPFPDSPPAERGAPVGKGGDLTWRDWLLMPLMGPVVVTAFLSGMVTQFLLEPLVALAWRQRKYMADATAVRLTRDPDAVAGALEAVGESSTRTVPWAAHLAFVADPRGQDGPFGRSLVPIFPPLDKRIRGLARMGAHTTQPVRSRMPWPIRLVIGLLLAVAGALMGVVVYLLVILSAAISGLFTIMPAALLHVLLRHFGR